jgi:hypothetical protein
MKTKSELNTVKSLVMSVLRDCPETRNNDNKLYVQCAKRLGAVTVDDIEKIGLSIISVHKVRQKIQNGDGLYLPTEDVKQARVERQLSFKEWMIDL